MTSEPLPSDLAAAHAMILAERAARIAAEAEAGQLKAERHLLALEIERVKLLLAKARHEQYGQSSERGRRLVEQLELQLEELEETAAAVTVAAETATPAIEVRSFRRRIPARRPLPESLPRRRIVYPAPGTCPCCGGSLRRLGEDVTETLERIPAEWLVLQHVREKFSCRSCEAITQPPAPSHPIARGRAGPNLLAEVAFAKFGMHLPLHRQSARFAAEGVELDVSTLADWIGAIAVVLQPIVEAIKDHALAAAATGASAWRRIDDAPAWQALRQRAPRRDAAPEAANLDRRGGCLGGHRHRGSGLLELFELQLELLDQPAPALGGLSVLLVPRLGEQQLHALDLERKKVPFSLQLPGLGLSRDPRRALSQDHRVRRGEVGGQRFGGHRHAQSIQIGVMAYRVTHPLKSIGRGYPAACGRHVCCGIRQSIPSSR